MIDSRILFSQVKLEAIIPEIILVGGILILLIVDLMVRNYKGRVAGWGTIVLIGLSLGSLTLVTVEAGNYLFGSITSDGYWLFFRILFGISTILTILMLLPHFPHEGEPFLLMAACLAGMNFVAGSGDIITLFVALELVSIPSYVLAGYRRSDPRSAEAALKYLLYGAVSSGVLVYGLSFLYGIGGTTKIENLAQFLIESHLKNSPAYLGAVLLVLAGIGYKVALVPLHFWAPDVYEGSPTPITAFF
ncbi:MAG: NADH-quinone oxidoreductase subunit N, partial [bacterium]